METYILIVYILYISDTSYIQKISIGSVVVPSLFFGVLVVGFYYISHFIGCYHAILGDIASV